MEIQLGGGISEKYRGNTYSGDMLFENDSKSFEANVITNADGSFNFNISNRYNGKIEAKFIFDNGNGNYTCYDPSCDIHLHFSDSSLDFILKDNGKVIKGTLLKK